MLILDLNTGDDDIFEDLLFYDPILFTLLIEEFYFLMLDFVGDWYILVYGVAPDFFEESV